MKKTLAAVAVLGAFAASASADVTVYGKFDAGLAVVNSGDTTTVKMATGQSSGNRWGLKGSEKVADGLTVGFQLEAGFYGDKGVNATWDAAKTTDGHRTFHRESRLWVATDYGTLHFGRMGTLDSGTGSVNLGGSMSAFGTGWGDADVIGKANYVTVLDTRRDNVITYQSPKMAGVTVYAQVAGEAAADGAEWSHDADRYMAVAAKYQAGAFDAMFTASRLEDSNDAAADKAVDDRDNFNAYVGYNFGVAKAMLQVNYMEQGDVVDNWGVVLSATAPLAGGKLLVEAGYGEATDAKAVESEKMNFAVGYQHTLSKQTYLYAGLGYNETKTSAKKDDATIAQFGICHSF